MRKAYLAIILVMFCTLGLAAEMDYRFKGQLCLESAVGGWEDPQWLEGRSTLNGTMELRMDEWEFLGQGRLQYNLEREYHWDLGELYVKWDSPAGRWTLGRQNVSWGQSLALPVLDVITPVDQRTLFTGLEENPSLPVEGLKWQYGFGSAQLELIYLRGYQGAMLPDQAMADLPLPVVQGETPEYHWDEGEFGGRLRLFLPFGDLGLMAFYGWEDLPLGRIEMIAGASGPEPVLSLNVERFTLVGWDSAIPMGPFLLRIENGYYLNRKFQRESMTGDFIEAHQVDALIGFDWIQGDWTIALETQGQWIPQDPEDLDQDHYGLISAAKVERSFAYGTWQASVNGMANWVSRQVYIEPSLIYKPADGVELNLGGFWLSEGDDTPFEEDSRVYLRCKLNL